MLRPGFLRVLSDWVSEYYAMHRKEMEKATEEFGLMRLSERAPEPDKVAAVFSEWLVFDRKSRIFDGITGLGYFVEHNPLSVSTEDLAAYKDLLQFKVGMFSIQSIDGGSNVTLTDMRERAYVVHDVTVSMYLSKGAVWARIARVAGIYQMVGSLFIPLPFEFGAGYKKMAAEWGERSMDAREAAKFLSPARDNGKGTEIMKNDPPGLTRGECEAKRDPYRKKFEDALRACGMREMLSAELYEKWLTDERRFPIGFGLKALYFLLPENVSKRDGKHLIDAAMHYGNYVPRPALKGRCPSEMRGDNEAVPDPNRLIVQDMYSLDPYWQLQEMAHEHMLAHEWRKAYDVYTAIIEDLLKDKIPAVFVIRAFANAAITCFNEGDARFALGEAILLGALRLNPQYDFALRVKCDQIDPLDDFSVLPKGISKRDISLIKNMRAIVKSGGERQYRRTVFRKYEDFIKKCGVSLSYKTGSTITDIPNPRKEAQKKPGRNEPCPCGSGKKYKKCCGMPRSARL